MSAGAYTNITPTVAFNLSATFITPVTMGQKSFGLAFANLFSTPVIPMGKWYETSGSVAGAGVFNPNTNLGGNTVYCQIAQCTSGTIKVESGIQGTPIWNVPNGATLIHINAAPVFSGPDPIGSVYDAAVSPGSTFTIEYGGGL